MVNLLNKLKQVDNIVLVGIGFFLTAIVGGVLLVLAGQGYALFPFLIILLAFAYAAVEEGFVEKIRSDDTSRTAEKAVDRSEEDPLSVIRERYARGEIDEGEFERKLDQLLETETIDQVKHRRNRSETEYDRE